ncbi:MAG: RluA family pseudouridine synthase [Rubrivivax sp.]|nr:MAG: RluA family pseudouridine synthase [Rubrivivax sp.]
MTPTWGSHQLLDYQPPPDEGLGVVFSDEHLVVVDKPAGLLSVPGRGERMADCLAVRVQRVFPDAMVVHRLDMDTSGLLVMARGADIQRRLSGLFMSRQVDKRYVAVVHGLLAEERGEVDLPLITDWPRRPRQKVDAEQGKPSLTRYEVVARDQALQRTRVALEPVTGRSHQLRVHLMAIGHAIMGDPLYGPDDVRVDGSRLLLHASELAFEHPATGLGLTLRSGAPF